MRWRIPLTFPYICLGLHQTPLFKDLSNGLSPVTYRYLYRSVKQDVELQNSHTLVAIPQQWHHPAISWNIFLLASLLSNLSTSLTGFIDSSIYFSVLRRCFYFASCNLQIRLGRLCQLTDVWSLNIFVYIKTSLSSWSCIIWLIRSVVVKLSIWTCC